MTYVIVHIKNRRPRKYDLTGLSKINVGRERDNTVIVGDPRVSRHHFQIIKDDEGYHVENISKTQTTNINGVPAQGQYLGEGDIINVGDSRIVFHLEDKGEMHGKTMAPKAKMSSFKYGDEPATAHVIDIMKQLDEQPPVDKRDPSQAVIIDPDQTGEIPNMMATSDPKQASVHSAIESLAEGRKSEQLRERFALLQDISQEMVSELRLDQLLKFILDKTFSVLNVDNGLILLVDPETRRLVPSAIRLHEKRLKKADQLRVSQTVLREAYQKKIGVLCIDAENDDQFAGQQSIIAFGMRSVMCVPLILRDEVLGLIHLDNESMHSAFSREDLDFLTMLAGQAAMAVHNARLLDKIVREETMRSHLERYFSPAIASKIAANEIQLDRVGSGVEATVLYSDIRNFTTLSEQTEPETLVEFLNTYFAAMADLVFEYDGTLDKYVGDALVAVFGSPIPDEEASLKAAQCALAMIETVQDMKFEVGEVKIGIGLHRGYVVHGNVGSKKVMQYTVIGDTVNTAARLSDKALPNQVVISRALRDAIPAAMKANPLGEMELKGKIKPIETFELLDE